MHLFTKIIGDDLVDQLREQLTNRCCDDVCTFGSSSINQMSRYYIIKKAKQLCGGGHSVPPLGTCFASRADTTVEAGLAVQELY
jgi:hypothetical protein